MVIRSCSCGVTIPGNHVDIDFLIVIAEFKMYLIIYYKIASLSLLQPNHDFLGHLKSYFLNVNSKRFCLRVAYIAQETESTFFYFSKY